MKRLPLLLAAFVVGAGGVASFTAVGSARDAKAPRHAQIVIRHQMRGCHAWSVNGGAYRVKLSLTLARGGTIRLVNDDVMPHKLIQKSGPAVRYTGKRLMNHMGASMKVTFPRAGVYRFTTKPGEDYPGIHTKTTGEDHVLRLAVHVS